MKLSSETGCRRKHLTPVARSRLTHVAEALLSAVPQGSPGDRVSLLHSSQRVS